MIKQLFILLFFISSLYAKTPSLEEMVAQMIMVGVDGSRPSDKWVKQLREDIEKNRVGGVILFANNIESPEKLKELTYFLSSTSSKYSPFIAIDQEGGKVQRLSEKNGFNSYPSAFKVSKSKTLLESYEIYKKMANELKEHGLNINFAPVVDLNINPNSPAIGLKKRSFSYSEEVVIAYSKKFLRAQEGAGIISVLKHFPGHGSALSGSHHELTDVSDTWEFRELKPYFDLIGHDKVDAVMVGHINLDKFDKVYPATLSKNILKGILRERLDFDEVVFSDDMKMKAISDLYGFEQSIVLAINAGVDVLLYSSYFTSTSSVIKDVTRVIAQAVKDGKIDKKEIEDSYKRIVRLKNDID